MSNKQFVSSDPWLERNSERHYHLIIFGRYLSTGLVLAGIVLFFYGLVWNYSTRRYLKGFSDAIVPLNGSPEQKSLALLNWLGHEPERISGPADGTSPRDPVGVVRDARLLKVCGSASNAFINLAEAAGIRARRLLLLNASGGAKHVVVEAMWDDRWVVVDPSFRAVFRDRSGRPLSKEELRSPPIFQDAISRIPNYSPQYTFDRAVHVHLSRIPVVGTLLRRSLNFLFPRWEAMANWGYLPEHPSLWPIVISLPLFVLGFVIRLIASRYGREQFGAKTVGFRKRLIQTSRVLLQKSA
jgi:Transglutaminase-like superfamily